MRFGSLFYEFKNDKGFLSTQFYTLFFLRRLGYILAHFYLDRWPFVKASSFIAFTIIILAYLVVYRPQKEKSIFFSCIIGEIAILNGFIINIVLGIIESEEDYEILEAFFIFGIFICMIIQSLISFYSFFVSIAEIYRKFEKARAIKFVEAHATLQVK